MQKISVKTLNIITASILIALTVVISSVCFLYDDTALVTGGESYAPIYSGDRGSSDIALMFNVYEGTDAVNGILDVLKDYGTKSTFFVGGCWADDNEKTLLRILEEGHEIGSHGYFHKDHSKLDESQNREEMQATDNLIRRLTGYDVKLFAPPSGAFSVSTLKVAENLGYKTIMWSKDTVDWRDKNSKTVYNRATKNVSGGDLILMHPKKHTLDALPKILEKYKSMGLTAVTVSECIG